jgi:uncharacterized protein YkwD
VISPKLIRRYLIVVASLMPKRTGTLSRSVIVWALLFLVILFAFPLMTSRAEEPNSTPLDPQTQMELTLLERINEVRASYGLHPYTLNSRLADAAGAHASEGAARNWMSHRGANGSSYYDRVAWAGYEAVKVNEAIGWGYNLEGMLNWWLNSPVHRGILLSSNYSEIGIGYVGNPDARWGHWWVVNVASPAVSSGATANAAP